MTNWFKTTKVNNGLEKEIKDILKNNSFIVSLCSYYNIPLSDIDNNLKIEVVDLDEKFSEGNGKVIRIDRKLLNKDFFDKNFHFVIHEFFHWLKRRSENIFYFNDSEEVQSFVLQITWDLINEKNEKEIEKKIYPIIRTHFKNKEDKARKFFQELLEKAMFLSKIYRK